MRTFKKDGITFWLLDLPNSNKFSYEIRFDLGSSIERIYPKEIYGCTHFIEHLSFKSTRDYDTQTLNKNLKKYGYGNATTSFDYMNFYMDSNLDYKEIVVDLVNNIALNDLTRLNIHELNIERDIVSSEIKMYSDDPKDNFNMLSQCKLFNLDINDNICGSVDVINNISKEDLIKIKSLFLHKENISVIIQYDPVEDIDALIDNLIIPKINNFIGDKILDKEFKDKYLSQDLNLNYNNPSIIIPLKDLEQDYIKIVFENINKLNLNFTLDYLNYYSENSLYEIIREKEGLTYYVSLGHLKVIQKDYIVLFSEIKKDNIDKFIRLFKQTLDSVISNLTIEQYDNYMINRKVSYYHEFSNIKKPLYMLPDIINDSLIYEYFKDKDLTNESVIQYYKDTETFENLKNNLLEFKNLVDTNKYIVSHTI